MVLNVHRNHKALLGTGRRREGDMEVGGRGRWGEGDYILIATTVTTRMTCIKMGSDESHFNVSLIVKDKVTRPCPQTTTFDEKG